MTPVPRPTGYGHEEVDAMAAGIEWRERDGKRYLRVDYTVTQDVRVLEAMVHQVEQEVLAAGPGQRVLAVVGDPSSAVMVQVRGLALQSYRSVHQGAGTVISVAGLSRSGAVVLRTFNALGALGRLAGFQDEGPAVDWLLSH